MTPGSLLLAPRSSPVAIASACWAVYVENNGRWQMAAHHSGRSPAEGNGHSFWLTGQVWLTALGSHSERVQGNDRQNRQLPEALAS